MGRSEDAIARGMLSSGTLAVLCAVASSVLPLDARAGGGYLRESKSLYAKLGQSYFSSHSFYTLDGTRRDQGSTFTQHITSLYVEYGLLEQLTLGASLPLLRINSFANTDSVAGVGDLELAVKSGAQVLGFHVAGAIAAGLPTGRSEAFAEVENDGGRINLPTGDGELNLWLRLGVSRSIGALDSYVSLESAVNFRTRGYSHQASIGLEVGHHLLEVVWLSGAIEGLFSLGEADASVPFIYGNGTELVRARFSVAGKIAGPLGLTADYSNVFAHIRNAYGGSSFGLGMYLDW